jgi:hypothetical protein
MMFFLPALAVVGAVSDAPQWTPPAHRGPDQWVVVGPLRVASSETPNRHAFDHDFLTALGSEAEAKLDPKVRVDGKEAHTVKADDNGGIDLAQVFGTDATHCAAYAYGEWKQARAGRLTALFGSDAQRILLIGASRDQEKGLPYTRVREPEEAVGFLS